MATDYGRDISCTDSLRTGRYVTGYRLIGEAIYRRLTTPRGTLRGGEAEENYGLDLVGLLGARATDDLVATLPDRIRNELLKDERIETVEVEIVSTGNDVTTALEIRIRVGSSSGPFSLVLGVNSVTAELLGITSEAA